MMRWGKSNQVASPLMMLLGGIWLAGCASQQMPAEKLLASNQAYEYIVGPGDSLNIFVWRNPELSQSVPVRPDGKISVPLVEDLVAAGKTSTQLAREIEEVLGTYIKEPLVTVLVSGFQGVYSTQIRVLGEASKPIALPYRDNMSVLDVMIAVGGLTEFADGNKALLVRVVEGKQQQAVVRLEDLIKDGDISANVPVAPGDVLIIPEAWF
ncbi:MAG: polysaccharide export outer membrane protein [Gammaproteobacteria bacterium]|jgi:polysaccharide export outer membrane protein